MEEGNSIRDDIVAAAAIVRATPAPEVAAAPAEPAVEAPAKVETVAPTEEAKPVDGRARGPDGKFVPKTGEVAAPVVEGVKPPPVVGTPDPKPAAPLGRAPQSWTPAAREDWAKVPASVQAEVARRVKEIASVMQEASEHRRVADAFRGALTPYQAMLGPNPIQGMDGILRTAHALANAPPQHKAQIIANLIRGYNVPLDALVAAVDNPQQQAAPPQQQAAPIDAQSIIAQVRQQMQQEQSQSRAQQELADFAAKPGNDFLADVKPVMLALLQGGVAKDLDTAYKQACWSNPEIRAIIQQRELADKAKANAASTQASNAAASSLRSEHTASSGVLQGSDDTLSDIRAAAARLRR